MNIRQFLRIVEIRTKIIGMTTFACGSLYAAWSTGTWAWSRFFIMGLAVLVVDMGTTGFNSYFDYTNGTDNKKTNLERDKVLVHEGVEPQAALAISLSLFGAAAMLGLVLAWMTSWWLIVAGGACMVVGYAYTGGPYPISRTPLGELFAGGFLGTVLFTISYYVIGGQVTIATVVASLPLMVVIAMVLSVNNTCDLVADTQAGRKTIAILVGSGMARRFLVGEMAIAFGLLGLLPIFGIYPWTVSAMAVPTAVIAVNIMKTMLAKGFSLDTKGSSMAGVSKIFLLVGASIFLGCAAQMVLA